MCLIEIKFTEKFSEKPSLSFLGIYKEFFKKAKLVKQWMESGRFYVRVYVRYPENMASHFIKNVLAFDSKFDKIIIIA